MAGARSWSATFSSTEREREGEGEGEGRRGREREGEGGRENLSLSMKRTISSAQKDRVKLERKEMITL